MMKYNELKDVSGIEKIMEELKDERKIFHNEADFQFLLAIKMKEIVNNIDIILEYCYVENEGKNSKRRKYIDIMIKDKKTNHFIAIELKYRTKKQLYIDKDNIVYSLTNQRAKDEGLYSICKDVDRLEKIINGKLVKGKRELKRIENLEGVIIDKGYVIFLTNDMSYTKETNSIFNFLSISGNELKGKDVKKFNEAIDNTKEGEIGYKTIHKKNHLNNIINKDYRVYKNNYKKEKWLLDNKNNNIEMCQVIIEINKE